MPTDWRFALLLIVFTFPVSILFLAAVGVHAATTRLDRARRLPDVFHWLLGFGSVAALVAGGVYLVNAGWG